MKPKKISQEELYTSIAPVTEDFGLALDSIEWKPFKENQIKWQRTMATISFSLPDYLAYSPIEVIREMIKKVLLAIDFLGTGPAIVFRKDVVYDHMLSRDFYGHQREVFCRRHHCVSGVGEVHDLESLLDILHFDNRAPFVDALPVWTTEKLPDYVGGDFIMRVIMIPKALDNEKIPVELIETLLINGCDRIQTELHNKLNPEHLVQYPDLSIRDEDEKLLNAAIRGDL